jgi:hypothetical protein
VSDAMADPKGEPSDTELLDALRALVAYVDRVGGFMKPEDQAMLQRARALLVECGR